MRTFAEKPKAAQPTKSAKSSSVSKARVGHGHDPNSILHLQSSIGNQEVLRLLQSNAEERNALLTGTALPHLGHDFARIPVSAPKVGALQPKLAISKPGNEYEQEADLIAEQMMRTPEPQMQLACPCGGGCRKCQTQFLVDRKEHVQTKRKDSSAATGTAPPLVYKALTSPGSPLDSPTRAFFEHRLGQDLSQVRVHTDNAAARSAAGINAKAYTVRQHVVFGEGRYQPHSDSGKRLLAHELVHTLQQAPELLREGTTCTRTFTRARSFSAYINLVREAETKLIAAGYTSVEDRIHVLRGIYYGTTWSADYAVERSPVRNAGFQLYTASTTPDDPRPILNCGLFGALRDSQDLTDGRRRVDAGHLMIGLDARRSVTARTATIPTQGGTGLDISTWLGDLGGGAGMLAFRRVTAPATSAMTVFRGTDFGGPINLEGDVAGFVVARDTTATPTGPVGLTLTGTATIADALTAYLLPTSTGGTRTEWNNRCRTFMLMKGATFDHTGALNNRSGFISALKNQIEGFACWYLVNRLRQTGRLSISTLRTASLHISGAAEEVATVFVDALDACQSTPGSNLAASGTGPTPTPIGSSSPTACRLAIRTLEAAEAAQRASREAERRLREFQDWLPF